MIAIVLAVALVAVASVFMLPERLEREREWRTVEKAIDWWDIEILAARTGADPLELLEEVREMGYGTVGVSDYDLRSLQQSGKVAPAPRPAGAPRDRRYFFVPEETLRAEMLDQLQLLGKQAEEIGVGTVGINVFPEEEDKVSLGWNRELIEALDERGFRVILRPRNLHALPPHIVEELLDDEVWEHAVGVVFSGDEVLGNGDRAALETVAGRLRERELFWGYVEFVGQKGESVLASLIPEQTVRTHSVPPDELKNYTPTTARDRLLRAVRERSIRLLYVRMFTAPSYNIWEHNTAYLSSLSDELERGGFVKGDLEPLSSFSPPLWAHLLFVLSVSLTGSVVWGAFLPGKWGVCVILAVVLGTLSLWGDRIAGMQYTGFVAGLAFPTLSVFLLIDAFREKRLGGKVVTAAFLVVFAGAFLVALNLFDQLFVLRIEQYWGVKVSFIVPLVLVALYMFRSRVLGVTIGQAVLGALKRYELVILAVLGIGFLLYVTRTGNFPLFPAGAVESRMRAMLEQVLFMRPRTKEFLIGYPALWVLLAYRNKPMRAAYRVVLWLALTVGFVTFFNSFCHIHTDFVFILLRFLNAFLLSIPVGLVYLAGIWLIFALWQRMERWGV